MRLLKKLFHENKGKTLLAIFAHPDDESFVSGGLLSFAVKSGAEVKVISITDGRFDENSREKEREFSSALNVLGISKSEIWKYKESQIKDFKKEIADKLKKEITNSNPFAIITFDPGGITGHTDHVVTSVLLLDLVKKLKDKPKLLWRISDEEEMKHFDKGKSFGFERTPTYIYNLPLSASIKKLKAIFSYKSQFKNLLYRLRIFDFYLFDHKEQYYLVNLDSDKFDIVFK